MSSPNRNKIGELVRRDPETVYLTSILVLLVIGFALILKGRFFSIANLQSIAFQMPELGVLSLAMMIPLLSGGLNLSIVVTANIAGITAAYILTGLIAEGSGISIILPAIILAILAAMAVSLLIGVVNGWIIAYLGVSPILATLGTMTLIGGLSVLITKGYVISGFPAPILFIGNGAILGIPVPMILFLICALIMSHILNRTPLGIQIYMTGSNETATLFSGIEIRKVILKVYIISGLLCGLAALIMIARFNSAKAGYGSSYLLVTILAAVLGGIDPFGGHGKIRGILLSLLILQIISSGFNLLGMSGHLTIAIWGALLLLSMGARQVRAIIGHLFSPKIP